MRSKCKYKIRLNFIYTQAMLVALVTLISPVQAQQGDEGASMPPPSDRQFRGEAPGANEQRPENFQRPGLRRPGNNGQMTNFRGRGGGMLGPLDLRPLNLTEAQKQKIQEMRQEKIATIRAARQNLRSKRMELKDLMFDPKASELQIRKKRQELSLLQDKVDEIMISDFLKLRSILTPEQLSRLPEVKPQMKGRTRATGSDHLPPRFAPGHVGQNQHFEPEGE